MQFSQTVEKSKLILAASGVVKAHSARLAGQESKLLTLRAVEAMFGELPPEAALFDTFETSDGLVRAQAADLDGTDAWSLRYSDPDTQRAGRNWIVEITSLVNADAALFSCRVSLYSPEQNFDTDSDTPTALKHICDQLTFTDHGFTFSPTAQIIGRDIDVTTLLRELTATDRWWNCIVLSPGDQDTPGLDPAVVHASVTGCANTYVLPEDQELEFAAAVGYDFNLVIGAARTYRPGFDVMSSEITAHPMIRPSDPTDADDRHAACQTLSRDAFRMSVDRQGIRDVAPSFATIRQRANRQHSIAAKASGDAVRQIQALEDLVQAERRNVDEAVALAIQSDDERQAAHAELENEKALNYALRLRIEALERNLQSIGGDIQTADPTSYGDVEQWATQNFSGKLRLSPRAKKGLRTARYDKITDVIDGIRLLAGPYRDMKRGVLDPAEFETECKSHGFDETRSISKIAAGQQGDAYFVAYAGAKHLMDRHLKKGTSKDARYCLRIYFFWDASNEMVIIGSLPEHLDTSAK